MTWTRLDDGWTDLPVFESLPYEARWHYLALLQFCSRTSRYDGIVRGADARRCSDVDKPAEAMMTLTDAGLVAIHERGYRLPFINDHVPPPYLRDESRKAGQRLRKQRERMHKNGAHNLCDPEHCPSAPVTGDVPRDTGTGRDRTGREVVDEEEATKEPRTSSVGAPLNPAEAECQWCHGAINPATGRCLDCRNRNSPRSVA